MSNFTGKHLSETGCAYLATLEREAAVPVAEVEAIIARAGFPCFAPWLEFQDRYAGYKSMIGLEKCIWGLVHRTPYWLPRDGVDIQFDDEDQRWNITCAEIHPSYNYQLDSVGEFSGGFRAESFDIHVERIAISWEMGRRGASDAIPSNVFMTNEFQIIFNTQILQYLVLEASDKYWKYYISDKYFVRQNAKTGDIRQARIFRR